MNSAYHYLLGVQIANMSKKNSQHQSFRNSREEDYNEEVSSSEDEEIQQIQSQILQLQEETQQYELDSAPILASIQEFMPDHLMPNDLIPNEENAAPAHGLAAVQAQEEAQEQDDDRRADFLRARNSWAFPIELRRLRLLHGRDRDGTTDEDISRLAIANVLLMLDGTIPFPQRRQRSPDEESSCSSHNKKPRI